MDAVVLYPQVGTKDDSADATGSLHAKMTELRAFLLGDYLPYVSRLGSVVSDTLRLSADTQCSVTNQTALTKKKEIKVTYSGIVRAKFEIYSSNGANRATAAIFVNDVQVGTTFQTLNTAYYAFSTDITVNANDLVQLYIATAEVQGTTYARNFRLYFDIAPMALGYVQLDSY